jgi:putative ABC transport system permease protein
MRSCATTSRWNRMALGADRGRITAMVLREGMTSVLVGLVIGMAGALALSTLVTGLLFGVGPNDPVCFAASAVVLVLAAVAGCLLPARRATAVNPITALRAEA